MHPGPPRKKLREERVDHRYSGYTPAFPAQWFYGLYVISPVNQLDCHRRSRIISRET
jgi:hypothetical protein